MLRHLSLLNLATTILMGLSITANAQASDGLCDKRFYKTATQDEIIRAVNQPNAVFLRCQYGETPLHRAVSAQNSFAIRAIVEAGGDVNARTEIGNTPLHFVVLSLKPMPELVDLLVELGANIHQTGSDKQTPLDMAKQWKEIEVAEELRESGARY